MADPASERGRLETLSLAGLGVLALVAQRADELADELGQRLGADRDEVRTAIADVLDSWRRDATRVGDSAEGMASRLVSELGVAAREQLDELELRVAQLEHRLRLLERRPDS